jgi:hypothetical protein
METVFLTKFRYHFSEKKAEVKNKRSGDINNSSAENKTENTEADQRRNFNAEIGWRTFQLRARSQSPDVTFYEALRKD